MRIRPYRVRLRRVVRLAHASPLRKCPGHSINPFLAGFAAEDRVPGFNPLHAHALQQPDGDRIAGIRDAEDPIDGGAVENERDRFADCRSGHAATLDMTCESEADLRVATIFRKKQPDVAGKALGVDFCDSNLCPGAGPKSGAVLISDRNAKAFSSDMGDQPWYFPELGVAAVGLKRGQVGAG